MSYVPCESYHRRLRSLLCTCVTYFQHKLTPLSFNDANQFGYLEMLDLDFCKDSLIHEVWAV